MLYFASSGKMSGRIETVYPLVLNVFLFFMMNRFKRPTRLDVNKPEFEANARKPGQSTPVSRPSGRIQPFPPNGKLLGFPRQAFAYNLRPDPLFVSQVSPPQPFS
jgi:hypothetical protein